MMNVSWIHITAMMMPRVPTHMDRSIVPAMLDSLVMVLFALVSGSDDQTNLYIDARLNFFLSKRL